MTSRNDATVQAFRQAGRQRLYLLVRVPLKTMRDIDFPERGPGYLDLGRVDASLREAATVWISDANRALTRAIRACQIPKWFRPRCRWNRHPLPLMKML